MFFAARWEGSSKVLETTKHILAHEKKHFTGKKRIEREMAGYGYN